MLTLQELKQVVSNREERRKVPSAKYLRENDVAVAKQRLMDCAEIIAYQTGYVLYCVGDYATVFPLFTCRDYVYEAERKIAVVEENFFDDQPWYVRLILEGEDRLWRNRETREHNNCISYRTTITSTSGKTVPCLQVVVERPNKKPLVATWGGISLVHKRKAVIEDIPYKVYGGRTELVKRLLAEKCELCGSTKNIEVHHIRKLADLKKKGQAEVPKWVQIMSARKRKTLVVCRECHVAIHNGNITKSS